MFRCGFWTFIFVSGISEILLSSCKQPKREAQRSERLTNIDSIPLPSKIQDIAERNIKIYYLDSTSNISDSLINGDKELRINGDVFLKVDDTKFPVYIYTSLMEMKVLQPSAFRIMAYDEDQGQSVESLWGEIKINKNYASPFPEPDTLRKNNLYMVNCSIDLSEKEDLDHDRLATWWERLAQTDQKED